MTGFTKQDDEAANAYVGRMDAMTEIYIRSFDGATMIEVSLGSFVNLIVARRLGLVSEALATRAGRTQ